VPAILDVTSPTPLTVQMAGLRVKLPYDTFAPDIRKIEIEDGILLGDVADVVPSRMRDYILVKIRPFSDNQYGGMMAKKVSALSTKDQFEERLAQIVEQGADRHG
jgi:hypothetical protein